MRQPQPTSRQVVKAVIPAAGKGTRLRPLTDLLPKECLPVGRRPVLQHVVQEALSCGLRQLAVVTGPRKLELGRCLEPFAVQSGIELDLAIQEPPRGLGDAVLTCRSWVGDSPFAVLLADTIIESRLSPLLCRMIKAHHKHRAAATIAVEAVPDHHVQSYGIVAPKGQPGPAFALRDVVEKPAPDRAPSNLAIAGRYVFEPVIMDALARGKPGHGGEIQLTDAIRVLIRRRLPVYAVPLGLEDRRHDIGNFATYYRAFLDYALADEELGASLRRWVGERLAELN